MIVDTVISLVYHVSLYSQPGWTLVTEPEEPVTQEKVDQVLVAANSKSPEQLYTYQHVTKALAKAITQRRQQNGSFTSLKDLLTVSILSGMGSITNG